MLLIAPRPCQRDTVELAQRLDLAYDVLCAYTSNHLGWFEHVSHTRIVKFSPDDRARELLEKLERRPEVIAFGNFEWNLLPRESEYEILRQVRDGTGSILAYHGRGQNDHLKRFLDVAESVDDEGYVTEGVPLCSLPAWRGLKTREEAANAVVSTRQFRRGRAVVFNYSGYASNSFLIPKTSDAEIHHLDYYFSLVAKAALWTARRESKVRLESFCLRDRTGAMVEEIARKDLKGAAVRISLRGATGVEGTLSSVGLARTGSIPGASCVGSLLSTAWTAPTSAEGPCSQRRISELVHTPPESTRHQTTRRRRCASPA